MKPGEKTAAQNREYKHAMGEQPNNVANKWLAAHRGKPVVAFQGEKVIAVGLLEAFDLYSFVVGSRLFFKGPGLSLDEGEE